MTQQPSFKLSHYLKVILPGQVFRCKFVNGILGLPEYRFAGEITLLHPVHFPIC